MATNWTSIFIPPDSPFKMGTITFDAVLQETHTMPSTVTKYPVESGAKISDNIILDPNTLTFTGLSTDYPFSFLGIGEGIPILETSKSIELFNVLVALRDTRQIFDVVTGLRSYNNMAIETISVPRTEPIAALNFNITLTQILKASAQVVKIPKDSILNTVRNAADQAPSKVAKGVQQGKALAKSSLITKWLEELGIITKRYA